MAGTNFGYSRAKVNPAKFGENFEKIKWSAGSRSDIKYGKSKKPRGSLLTSFQRTANEFAYDVLRADIKDNLKRGDYDNAPKDQVVFDMTGETMAEIQHNRNPQGGDY